MNQIIDVLKKHKLVSFLLIFVLWVRSLTEPDQSPVTSTLKQDNSLEITQKALAVSGGDGLPGLFSAKKKKFDPVLHARLMKTFPDWPARMDYQKKQEAFYKSAMKKQSEVKRLRLRDNSRFLHERRTRCDKLFPWKRFLRENPRSKYETKYI